jgi:hypothetical protein
LFLFALLLFLPARIFPYVSLYGLWIFLIWLFLMFYLRMPERVFLPPLLFLKDMVIFYAVPKNKGQGETRTTSTWTFKGGVVSLVLLSFFTFFFLQKEFAKNKNWSYNESVLNASTAGFHPQDNQLYVIWDSAFPFELMGAFDDFELFRHFHVVMLAGHQRSPQAHSMMTHFGVKNLFRDLVDNPDLFLICSRYEMDLYKAHMREKHQMETDFEAVFTSPFFAAYRIHSVKTAVSSTSKKD